MPDLLEPLSRYGMKYETISVTHLTELEQEYITSLTKFRFNQDLYKRYINHIRFKPPDDFRDVQSVIIVAVPSFCTECVFNYAGRNHKVIIPPIYRKYYDAFEEVKNIISEFLDPGKYKFVNTSLPQKFLAVHSGLASYGKNNITYVTGLGSYLELVSFYSNLPCNEDHWYDLRMLDRCNNCTACIKVCPTGAIDGERFIINADKCLTYFNENEIGFPEWIKPDAHNSLIGCIHCQYRCPENKKFRDIIEYRIEFTQNETEEIIDTANIEKLGILLRQKLTKLGLVEIHTNYANLRRNLLALILPESPGNSEIKVW